MLHRGQVTYYAASLRVEIQFPFTLPELSPTDFKAPEGKPF